MNAPRQILGRTYDFVASGYFIPTQYTKLKLKLRGCSLGRNVIFEGGLDTAYPRNIAIGEQCLIGYGCSLRPELDSKISIGAFTYIGTQTRIIAKSGISIGNWCMISPGCYLADFNHGMLKGRKMRLQPDDKAPISIGDDVWLGVYSVVTAGIAIGDGAVIGAHSVVTRDVEPFSIAAGAPARKIGERHE